MSTTDPVALPLSLGQQIANARRRMGLTQTALGQRWNLSRTTISRYERGDDEPSFSQMVDLANASGWPLELFAQAHNPQDPTPPAGDLTSGESSSACTSLRLAEVVRIYGMPA